MLQADDTLGFTTHEFLEEGEDDSNKFRCKPRKLITEKTTIFNGTNITKPKLNHLTVQQTDKSEILDTANTQKEFFRTHKRSSNHSINLSSS